jgi:uncharacterized protein YlxW (UPF0749 family)
VPKIVVCIISVAFALVIGFACGALLTKPENSKMEQLINKNKIYQKEISDINSKSEALKQSISQLEQKNTQLRDDLLNVYKNMEKIKNSSNIEKDKSNDTSLPKVDEFK